MSLFSLLVFLHAVWIELQGSMHAENTASRLIGTDKRPRVYECYWAHFRGGNPLERIVAKPEKCPRKRAMQLKKCRTSRLRAMLAIAPYYHSLLAW